MVDPLGSGGASKQPVRQPSEQRVPPELENARIDKVVSDLWGVSRKEARIWIGSGRVRIGGKVVKVLARRLKAGKRVEVLSAEPVEGAIRRPSAEGPPVEIIHLQRELAVVNKPAGLLSEGLVSAPSVESLWPTLMQNLGESPRVWLVHRLDATTSGVMVVARKAAMARELGNAFREGTVQKGYLALVQGLLMERREVNQPIGRLQGTRHGVVPGGKPASTRVTPLARGEDATLVWAEPRTGRTHQIRVHLAHLGHPLWGDSLYRGPRYIKVLNAAPAAVPRAMLHAARLILPGVAGRPLTFEALPPPDFIDTAGALGIDTVALP